MDIQAAVAQRAGVGRYVKSMIEALTPLADGDELRYFYFDFKRNGPGFELPAGAAKGWRWLPGRWVQGAWKAFSFPPFDWLAGRADVFHFPNFILPPLAHGRAVVTIHDVSFLRLPDTTEQKNLAYLKARIHRTVQRADAIITDSVFSAREIVELLRAPPEKVFPIHLGLAENIHQLPDEDAGHIRRKFKLDRPYLLMVGTLEPRKNIPFLVSVFERMELYDGDLVIAGMRGWKYEPILDRIKSSRRADRIRYLEYVTDRELSGLYSGADLLVYPSLYEGFGFPPLEAMACGLPVVCSAGGSLPEVVGEAALVLENFDAELWAYNVFALLTDATRRAQLRAAGLRQAQLFSWRDTAQQTWELYRRIAGD